MDMEHIPTIEYTLHLFYPDPGLPPLLSISGNDGYNYVIGEDDVDKLIAILTRYQRGEHDGVISDRDPRTYRHIDDADNQLMTVEAVAKTYGIQAGTVRRTIHMGWLKARKSGKNWLIKRGDAESRWGKIHEAI